MKQSHDAATLPDYEASLARVLALAREPLGRGEMTPLDECSERVLAEDVHADRDLPPFNRAMMDGYALRAADLHPGAAMPVIGDVPAGADANVDVPVGSCVRIATGAPVPAGLDTVIEHERSDRGEPVRFALDRVESGRAIHPRGADAKRGDVIITAGTRLGPHHIGVAAAAGCAALRMRRRPRVVIFTSGDEVRDVSEPVAEHQIRNSNAPMLLGAVRCFGGEASATFHLRDDREETIGTMRTVLENGAYDIVITVGGVSAGERDYFPLAYEALGFSLSLTGARIQPGRPICAGARNPEILIGLPGNPVSALVCSHLFIRPLIARMSGDRAAMPWRSVELAEEVRPNPSRQAFRPARLVENDRVIVPRWAGSGDLVHTAATDGIVALPVQDAPVAAGSRLQLLAWT